MTRFPKPTRPISHRFGDRACTCCGVRGLTLDGDGVCHECWADAEKKSADHVDGYDRDNLGESLDY